MVSRGLSGAYTLGVAGCQFEKGKEEKKRLLIIPERRVPGNWRVPGALRSRMMDPGMGRDIDEFCLLYCPSSSTLPVEGGIASACVRESLWSTMNPGSKKTKGTAISEIKPFAIAMVPK